ncbi:hypothetical protein [Nocardia caishijiensis]|uniref:DUF222 domain-containing protein n=1 Tax=Nocardia caishijiensis TaxID=184756 RepID=A0ABQ6YGE7_9NOCA|nr:hypothetical protein [Nocardia caishijiensis]KAF0836755.1 hypothetical protein FNL39_11270 [Nocardia caishijiensis]
MLSCDDIAAAWLAHTEFAGDHAAVGLLSRAISPKDFDIKRDSLPVAAAADPATAAAILQLLERGQVPTMAAIRTLTAQNEMRREAERIERLGRRAQRSIDEFGRILARLAAAHWTEHGIGPTRRDILADPQITDLIADRVGAIAPTAVKHLWLIERAQRAGWIASNASPGSLCPARRWHTTKYGNRVSQKPVNMIGKMVAGFVAEHTEDRGRAPSWVALSRDLRDDRGRRVFFDVADAHAQRRWLVTAEWLADTGDDLPAPGKRGLRALAKDARG